MRVRIDLLPSGQYDGELVLLVDVLRSCTVAPILFDNGLERLTVSASLREARRAASDGRLLVGERGGVPPEGFNYANSPSALLPLNVAGRSAVLVSDNAPRALPVLDRAKDVFLASLYNAGAAVQAVRASGSKHVSIVCCGHQGQEDLDDSVTAGFLAGQLRSAVDGTTFEGASHLVLGLLRAFPDPLEALWHSSAGRELRRLEFAEDLAVASTVSQSPHVPRLVSVDPGNRANLYHFDAVRPT